MTIYYSLLEEGGDMGQGRLNKCQFFLRLAKRSLQDISGEYCQAPDGDEESGKSGRSQ